MASSGSAADAAPIASGAAGSAPAKPLPWVEKYRPKTVDEVAHQDEVVSALKAAVEQGSLPHLLFYGPPGTGKTSTILALSRQMFGDLRKERVLELNASDERGIQVVREKIKIFASAATASRRGYPPFKLIILDEADSMTADAQAALRRTMEAHSRVTRFCLICNYVSRIIEPLASRCAKFRFKPLDRAPMMARLRHISEAEGTGASDECLERVLDVSGGDMRAAVNALQSCYQMFGAAMTPEAVVEAAGRVPDAYLEGLIEACRTGSVDAAVDAARVLLRQGFPMHAVIDQLQHFVLRFEGLSDTGKAKLLLQFARTDKRLADGADEELQLQALAAGMTLEMGSVA